MILILLHFVCLLIFLFDHFGQKCLKRNKSGCEYEKNFLKITYFKQEFLKNSDQRFSINSLKVDSELTVRAPL